MKYIAHIPLIGGFPLAAMKATGENPQAVTSYTPFFDNDNLYLRYLKKKNIDIPYYNIDKEENITDLSKFINKLDFVVGTPPCAGLSAAASLSKEDRLNSTVNDWMINSVEYVIGTLKPTVYTFENAPGLYTEMGAHVRAQLIDLCKTHGYAITFYKTDTLHHGIPQRRPRTYAILLKGNQAPKLRYTNSECPSVAEYLKDIPANAQAQDLYMSKEFEIKNFEIVKFLKEEYGNKWREEFLNTKDHLTSYDFLTRKDLLQKYKKFIDDNDQSHPSSVKDINHVIKKIGMGKNYRLSHRVLCLDKHHVYAVIGEMMERNIHPTEDRRMNMREYMHLMGMPHDMEIYDRGEFGKLPQNTPVNTSKFIVEEIMAIVKGERELSNDMVYMQNNIKYNQTSNKEIAKMLF